jgi:Linalool dehydratase/isomerase
MIKLFKEKRSLKFQLSLLAGAMVLGGFALHRIGINPFATVPIPVRSDQQTYPSQADAVFAGDLAAQKAIASQVIADIRQGIDASKFQTGSDRFNSEWTVAMYQMTALGLSQMALAHPELRDEYIPVIETCLYRLLTAKTLAFGAEAWGKDAIADLASNNGHAYMGYTNLALSKFRQLKPKNRFAALNDRLTDALARRLAQAPHGIIDTYPSEAYPPDLSAVIGSIALHDRATGSVKHQATLKKVLATFRTKFVDPSSGLVFQAVDAKSGHVLDKPRASGSTLSAYFLSFADPELAKTLFQTIQAKQQTTVMGLTAIREYPPGQEGSGDVDSGPLIFGASPTASVFAMSGARMFGDRPLFTALYRSMDLFGSFSDNKDGIAFQIGGPLGKAILLAMVTAK